MGAQRGEKRNAVWIVHQEIQYNTFKGNLGFGGMMKTGAGMAVGLLLGS